jgi:hypothetical protein
MRAAAEKAAAERPTGGANGGNPFGLPAGADEDFDPSSLELPADLSHDEVVLVLEGGARGGVRRGRDAHVRVTHASGQGDDAIVTEVTILRKAGHDVTAVTADRMLKARLEGLGAQVVGPAWLLEQLTPA